MASAHRCRLPPAVRRGAAPGAVDGHDRQASAGYQAGDIAGLVGDLQAVRPSGCSRHWICQSLTGTRALICSRAAVAADRVGIGPVAAGLAAVIGCSGVRPAVVSRRRAGDRCCE
jgi:hypothetical protein